MADSLVVIRPGATAYDLQGRISGTLDMPLSPAGAADAQRIAAALAIEWAAGATPEALLTAPAAAAQETARIIGRAVGLRPRRLPALANIDLGLWQGMLVDEIRTKQPRLFRQWQDNPWCVAPPDGELLEQACGRVEAALEKLLKRRPSGRVALVVPTPLDRIVRWLAAGEPLTDLWSSDPLPALALEVPLAAQWRSPEPLVRLRS